MTHVLRVGGGHPHLIAASRLLSRGSGRGVRLARAAWSSKLLYSGMMQGRLAGRHRYDGCASDLGRVAVAAGLERIEDTIVTVELRARQAAGAGGRGYTHDMPSLNVREENSLGEPTSGSSSDSADVIRVV